MSIRGRLRLVDDDRDASDSGKTCKVICRSFMVSGRVIGGNGVLGTTSLPSGTTQGEQGARYGGRLQDIDIMGRAGEKS